MNIKEGAVMVDEQNRQWRLVMNNPGTTQWLAYVVVSPSARIDGISPPLHLVDPEFFSQINEDNV